ncbi:MAG: nucleotidyltransferase [Deltaproteobacteria bacterium]|nr:nucleotidyltransferase [Deltaproteobacteria bacterium]
MAERRSLEPFLHPLKDLLHWLRKAGVPHLIIGGIATGFLGRPRATRDIDGIVFLDIADLDRFYALASVFGFVPRRENALAFARRRRILLMHHKPSAIDVDLSLGALPFEDEAIRRGHQYLLGSLKIPLPTPEDLIIMKATAHRDVDLKDIEGLIAAHPDLDRRRIRRWVKEFARVLEMPEIFDDVNRLLTSVPQRAKRPQKRKK